LFGLLIAHAEQKLQNNERMILAKRAALWPVDIVRIKLIQINISRPNA
jgi:hypothetical protein